jgi:hypothetical protein
MSNTPEAKVKMRVKAVLDEYECFHNWPVPAGYGVPILDCVGCHRGLFFMVETKAPGEHLTPRQEFTRDLVEIAEGKVFIIGESLDKDPFMKYSGMRELIEWLQRK